MSRNDGDDDNRFVSATTLASSVKAFQRARRLHAFNQFQTIVLTMRISMPPELLQLIQSYCLSNGGIANRPLVYYTWRLLEKTF